MSRIPRCLVVLAGIVLGLSTVGPLEVPSASAQVKKKALFGKPVRVPRTFLQIERQSGDFAKWGTRKTITQNQTLRFRWWTHEPGVVSARWQLYRKSLGPLYIVKSGVLRGFMAKGKARVFTVGFGPGLGWGDYFVRLTPYRMTALKKAVQVPRPNVVTIRFNRPGTASVKITVSRVRITIDKIIINNDGDRGPRGAGELTACIWVEYSGRRTPSKIIKQSVNTGDTLSPNLRFVLPGTPRYATVRVRALESDCFEGTIPNTCGYTGPNCKGGSDDDIATGKRIISIPPGATQTPKFKIPSIIVSGRDDLKLTVEGTWQVIP